MSRSVYVIATMIVLGAFGCGRGTDTRKATTDKKVTVETSPQPIVLPSVVETGKPTPTQTLGPVTPPTEAPIVEKAAVPTTYREILATAKQGFSDGRLDEAQTLLEQAATLKPDFLAPQLELARLHLAKNDADAATPYADRAVEIDEKSSAAWNTKGRVEMAKGNTSEAILAFERSTEENPDNSHAWNNLGYLYLMEKQYADAASALESATTGTQVTPYMWNNLGMAYEHLNRLDDARSAYRRAAESGSSHADKSLTRLQGVTTITP